MKYYGGIDLGGTNTKIGLLDEKGTLILKTNIKTSSEEGYEITVKRICEVLIHEIEAAEISMEDVVAFGVGIPGPVVKKNISYQAQYLSVSVSFHYLFPQIIFSL